MTIQTSARNASLGDLHELLRTQHAAKLDAVVAAKDIRAEDGNLVLEGVGEPELTPDGVTSGSGTFRVMEIADGGIATKLDIPLRYVRRMRQENVDLYDKNVNGWLKKIAKEDPTRTFLVRTFRGQGGEPGIARAFLSDRYSLNLDNLDALVAVLGGVQQAGLNVEIPAGGMDLSEHRMVVRIVAPQVQSYAPALLANYRSPFASGDVHRVNGGGWTPASALAAAQNEGRSYDPGTEPVVFAGLQVSNSELGTGALSLSPVIVARICANGLTMTSFAVKAVHLGGKLDQGVVNWSTETQEANAALITSKARDAVTKFFDPAFIAARVAELEVKAQTPVTDAVKAVELVSKKLAFTEHQAATVLSHFIMGGQMTAGGVVNAITSASQTISDPDAAYDMDSKAMQAFDLLTA